MESKKICAYKDGLIAERLAKEHLEKQGLKFLESNFKVKLGEIDLIFQEQQQLVFVEVKYRTNKIHGSAAEQFTHSKRVRLIRAIKIYLQKNNLNFHNTSFRIDLVAIDLCELNWIKNV